MSKFQIIQIEDGDSLSKIALRTLKQANRWPEIAKLNNLSDPFTIYVGHPLIIPEMTVRSRFDKGVVGVGKVPSFGASGQHEKIRFEFGGTSAVARSPGPQCLVRNDENELNRMISNLSSKGNAPAKNVQYPVFEWKTSPSTGVYGQGGQIEKELVLLEFAGPGIKGKLSCTCSAQVLIPGKIDGATFWAKPDAISMQGSQFKVASKNGLLSIFGGADISLKPAGEGISATISLGLGVGKNSFALEAGLVGGMLVFSGKSNNVVINKKIGDADYEINVTFSLEIQVVALLEFQKVRQTVTEIVLVKRPLVDSIKSNIDEFGVIKWGSVAILSAAVGTAVVTGKLATVAEAAAALLSAIGKLSTAAEGAVAAMPFFLILTPGLQRTLKPIANQWDRGGGDITEIAQQLTSTFVFSISFPFCGGADVHRIG